ncbi:DUF7660 family protein [Micromonospora sp. MH99]|uniref:DUF7660 family protein n=1 Tax=unclassified Micromonospora TaxID=2617518 RepID=UPI001F45697B|nr:hypothetical protein [Micromonospora sp. MH99]MCF0092239.1 hypothetical protein [Micromonospora sp. MH99]
MTEDDNRPLKRVDSLDDLVTWLRWIADDVARDPDTVENMTTDRYLEACAAYLQDRSRLQKRAGQPLPAQPTWQLLADALHAGCFYE